MGDTFDYGILEREYGKREANRLFKLYQVTGQRCPECKTGFIMISRTAKVDFDGEGYSAFIEMICTKKECEFNPIREVNRLWED